MQKYSIEYQLEDSEPESAVVKAKDKEHAIEVLKKTVYRQLINESFLEKEEALELVGTMQVLELSQV